MQLVASNMASPPITSARPHPFPLSTSEPPGYHPSSALAPTSSLYPPASSQYPSVSPYSPFHPGPSHPPVPLVSFSPHHQQLSTHLTSTIPSTAVPTYHQYSSPAPPPTIHQHSLPTQFQNMSLEVLPTGTHQNPITQSILALQDHQRLSTPTAPAVSHNYPPTAPTVSPQYTPTYYQPSSHTSPTSTHQHPLPQPLSTHVLPAGTHQDPLFTQSALSSSGRTIASGPAYNEVFLLRLTVNIFDSSKSIYFALHPLYLF